MNCEVEKIYKMRPFLYFPKTYSKQLDFCFHSMYFLRRLDYNFR